MLKGASNLKRGFAIIMQASAFFLCSEILQTATAFLASLIESVAPVLLAAFPLQYSCIRVYFIHFFAAVPGPSRKRDALAGCPLLRMKDSLLCQVDLLFPADGNVPDYLIGGCHQGGGSYPAIGLCCPNLHQTLS